MTQHMDGTTLGIVVAIIAMMFIAKMIYSNGAMIIAGIIQVVWGITQLIFFIPFIIVFDMLMFILWILISMVNGGHNEFESLTGATLRDIF